MSLVKRFSAVDGIMSIKKHFNGAFGFCDILDPAFLFMEEIWNNVQKVSGSILSSISSQILVVSPANNDRVGLWPNLWCNNYKGIFFLDGSILVFEISFIPPKNTCFLCALCGRVTSCFFLLTNYNVKNSFWNKQVCPKLINITIENNLVHRSGAKIMLCNVAIKVSPLSPHIFI